MRLLPNIIILIFILGCGDSDYNSSSNSDEQSLPKQSISTWVIDGTKIDLGRNDINFESRIESHFNSTLVEPRKVEYPELAEDSSSKRDLIIEFAWTPKDIHTEKPMENENYDVDYLHLCEFFITIPDTLRISKHVDYSIPSPDIRVKGRFYGIYSNFEWYKKVTGKVRFEELSQLNCKFKILLKGELNEMTRFENDTILYEEIRIVKETRK